MDEKLLPETTSHAPQLSPRPRRKITGIEAAKIIAGNLTSLTVLVLFALTVVLLVRQVYVDVTDPSRRPEILAVVDGASGLDGRAPRAFNLTVTIDNLGGKYNVRVGGDAVVLYRGVPLAAGSVQELCVPPHGAGKLSIHAASGGVGLPTELARMVAEEMERSDGVVQLEVLVVSSVVSLNQTSLVCKANLNVSGGAVPAPSPCARLVLRDESDGVTKDLVPFEF